MTISVINKEYNIVHISCITRSLQQHDSITNFMEIIAKYIVIYI